MQLGTWTKSTTWGNLALHFRGIVNAAEEIDVLKVQWVCRVSSGLDLV